MRRVRRERGAEEGVWWREEGERDREAYLS